jgi:hypothetical protein
MAELVEDLDQYDAHVQQDEIIRSQDFGTLMDQLSRIADHKVHSRRDDREPHDQTDPTEKPSDDADPSVKEMVRVDQWNPNKKQVREESLDLTLDAGAVPVEKTFRIRCQLSVEKVGTIELSEELDDLSLGRRAVAIFLVADSPDFGDSSPAVKHSDELIGPLADAREFVVRRILQHVPHLSAKVLPVDLDAGEQSRP